MQALKDGEGGSGAPPKWLPLEAEQDSWLTASKGLGLESYPCMDLRSATYPSEATRGLSPGVQLSGPWIWALGSPEQRTASGQTLLGPADRKITICAVSRVCLRQVVLCLW